MKTRARKQWIAGGALGAVLIGTVALSSSAIADEDIDISVEIESTVEPGVLAFSVASNAVTLTENGSDEEVRQFTGTLPEVTVTDTRTAEEIPDGAAWAVLGSASDFTSGDDVIGAEHLGWTPNLLEGDEDGLVSEGEEVVTVLDEATQPGNNVGLVDQELLISTFDSGEVAGGEFSVNADLFLRTPADVAGGSYSSTLTLSLFE
ncbi:hypothetical protein [Oerskovia flava]|uniref:hypothetical protein n=1 Tax=Oerskovia flava TaxID=2986422 RepID=UPI00223FFEB1|nr:hypothetical protein [Oerskovia sp. JB1-3-2]